MPGTTPSRTSSRATSAQSHCDSDRPLRSGRSQAILTACSATEGGKDGLAPAPGSVVQARQAVGKEPLDPLADVLLGQTDLSRGARQAHPIGDRKDRPASPCQAQRGGRATEPVLQELPLLRREGNHRSGLAAAHDEPPAVDPCGPTAARIGKSRREFKGREFRPLFAGGTTYS